MTLTFTWHKTFQTVAVTTLLLVPAISLGSPKAFTQEEYEAVTFTLENGTNEALMEFYASPPSPDDWEEDILGEDVLGSGETRYKVLHRQKNCTFTKMGCSLASGASHLCSIGAIVVETRYKVLQFFPYTLHSPQIENLITCIFVAPIALDQIKP